MNTKGTVSGVVSNLVTVRADGPVSQNEICYVRIGGNVGDERQDGESNTGVSLMAEVIKVVGQDAYVQVFDSTRGLRVGDSVEFAGHMLEVTRSSSFRFRSPILLG